MCNGLVSPSYTSNFFAMKYLFLSLVFSLLTSSSINAQNGKVISFVNDSLSIAPDSILYDLAALDKPPCFPDGQCAWVDYMGGISKRVASFPKGGYSAKVTMTFIVEKDGNISNKRVLSNQGSLLHLMLEVIDQMPCWIPAMKNGQPVRVQYLLPIRVCVE